MEDKDIEEYNKIGWELKWNKRFIYPKSQRDIVMGRRHYEIGNDKFKRSLYFVRAKKAGDKITTECIRSIRPGYGIEPKYTDFVVGNRVIEDVEYGSPVLEKLLEKKIK